jgi:hypothetical protein
MLQTQYLEKEKTMLDKQLEESKKSLHKLEKEFSEI